MQLRLGLYGGSFDPVHCGHLLVAQAALEELELQRLFFIPASRSPFKPGSSPAPPAVRARMLRLALAGRAEFTVDDFELQQGGVSYTIETVRHFRQRYAGAELYWLIGADHVATLPQWRDAEALASLIEFVVIPRPGETHCPLPTGFRGRNLGGWPLGISSSEIRNRVQSRRPVHHLVPPGIAETIEAEALYRRGNSPTEGAHPSQR